MAKHDADVLRFFARHPRLASTPAGRVAVLQAQWRTLVRLQAQVRSQAVQIRTLRSARRDPVGAIRYVFGAYAEQALAVARCESGYSVNATNGQYLGLFQMGDYARGAYGHSLDALGQARSAYAYFVASGRDWSPWECKPWW